MKRQSTLIQIHNSRGEKIGTSGQSYQDMRKPAWISNLSRNHPQKRQQHSPVNRWKSYHWRRKNSWNLWSTKKPKKCSRTECSRENPQYLENINYSSNAEKSRRIKSTCNTNLSYKEGRRSKSEHWGTCCRNVADQCAGFKLKQKARKGNPERKSKNHYVWKHTKEGRNIGCYLREEDGDEEWNEQTNRRCRAGKRGKKYDSVEVEAIQMKIISWTSRYLGQLSSLYNLTA